MKDIKADIKINRLKKDDFEVFSKNGFISMTYNDKTYERVFFYRAFPFDMLYEYICVLDDEQNEIGIIYNLDELDESSMQMIKTELERRYYQSTIKSIQGIKERYGFSYWNIVTTDDRKVSFTVKDTFRSIIRIGDNKAIVVDVDGNRFVIESIAALDRKSYRKIELYL